MGSVLKSEGELDVEISEAHSFAVLYWGVPVLRPGLYWQQESRSGVMVTVILRFTDNYGGWDRHGR